MNMKKSLFECANVEDVRSIFLESKVETVKEGKIKSTGKDLKELKENKETSDLMKKAVQSVVSDYEEVSDATINDIGYDVGIKLGQTFKKLYPDVNLQQFIKAVVKGIK